MVVAIVLAADLANIVVKVVKCAAQGEVVLPGIVLKMDGHRLFITVRGHVNTQRQLAIIIVAIAANAVPQPKIILAIIKIIVFIHENTGDVLFVPIVNLGLVLPATEQHVIAVLTVIRQRLMRANTYIKHVERVSGVYQVAVAVAVAGAPALLGRQLQPSAPQLMVL